MKIHLWAPGMDASHGGIQAYSSEVFQALEKIYGWENVLALSLNDAKSNRRNVIHFGGFPTRLRKTVFALEAAIQAFLRKPDLLFLTHPNLCPLAQWLGQTMNIPYVAGAHGFELGHLHGKRGERALLGAKQVLPVSDWTRNVLLKKFPSLENRCTVVPNTFDAERFCLAEKSSALLARYSLPASAKIILTVARLSAQERYKGVDEMIRAMPTVLAKVPAAHYLVVGQGDDLPRLRQLAEKSSLAHRVIFCGFVSETELPAHYQLCDVYAMPSRGEGFGITFLEALSCGKPVLAGNLDASPEALLDGKLGRIVSPQDISAIADSLIALLNKVPCDSKLFDPQWLRAGAIAAFGRERFTERLRHALSIS